MFFEFICDNYDIQEGLVNGIEDIFRASTTTKSGTIWIEIVNPTVGSIRSKMEKCLIEHLLPEFLGILN